MISTNRRNFLRSAAGASMFGAVADWQGFSAITPVAAEETAVTPDIVRFDPSIEPLVKILEETPREKCPEMMVERLRHGVTYRQFLAALFLAGIRNVNPQPPGFKFHCVFVIHAAHQLGLDAPVQERLLPLFWALDEFKKSQAEDVTQGDFVLRPVKGNLPAPEKAWEEFHAAMEAWDEVRADRAIAALVRSRGAHEIIEGLWRYGARDYRNIGHKAIFVANSWRTLQTIGWQHAEPVLRSLVLGLLDFKDREVNGYRFADQVYELNKYYSDEAIAHLTADWTRSVGNSDATNLLLKCMRTEDPSVSCGCATGQMLKDHAGAGAIWDAVHLFAGELMMRQPGIYGTHTVTSVNALHFAYRTATNPTTRLLLLLQAVGWMCQFRKFMGNQPQPLSDVKITELAGTEVGSTPEEGAEQILAKVSSDSAAAASAAFAYSQKFPVPEVFERSARQLIFRKAADPHHYKYAAAIFEDYDLVSPEWRPHLLATSVYYLRGSETPDSPLMQQVREAVRTL